MPSFCFPPSLASLLLRTWIPAGLLLILSLLFGPPASAQPAKLIHIDDPMTEFLIRQRAAGRLPDAHLAHLPLSGAEAIQYLDSLEASDAPLPETQRRLLDQYRRATPQPGAQAVRQTIGGTYANGHDLLAVEDDDYALHLNPLLYVAAGPARYTTDEGSGTGISWQGSGGFQASGRLGDHLFFDSRLEYNLRRLPRRPPEVDSRTTTLPRQGWVRFSRARPKIYEYWDMTGVVGYRTDHVEVRFGHTRNRWGYGKSSMVLSNYAPEYDQLQIRTSVWRLQYTNLFARFNDYATPNEGGLSPHRYGAFHRLDVNVSDRVSISLFESIIFGPDSLSQRADRFELSYLNPLLFYKAVQHNLEVTGGTPDNSLLGAGGRVRIVDGVEVYAQLLLDEFKPPELVSGDGWWGNKWGFLAGAHLAEAGIEDLSLRMEFGQVRPYTYSHRTTTTAYVHARDLLGYPAGPNTRNAALFLRYHPSLRVRGGLNLAYTWGGRNTETENWGADPLRSFNSRVRNFGNTIGQGVPVQTLLGEAFVGYQLLPDLWIEAALHLQSRHDDAEGLDRQIEPLIQLRWNRPFESRRW